jgi:pre-mRNA branch site protein p14
VISEFCILFYKILNVHFINRGNKPETRGTAFVVYEDIFDAKNAAEHLSGFNVMGR